MNISKIANVSIYSISFVLFVLSIAHNSMWLGIFALPFMLLMCSAIHEIGHCVGCIINQNIITELYLPLFSFGNKGIKLNSLRIASYCSFKKKNKNVIVYALGPVFSMIFTVTMWLVYGATKSSPIYLCGWLSFVILLINVIPFKKGDVRMMIEELRK